MFLIKTTVQFALAIIQNNSKAQSDYDYMKENLRLRKELEEAQKEVLFLKKAAAFFAKEID